MYCGAGRWLGAGWERRRGAGHAGGTLGAQTQAAGERTAGSGVRGARQARGLGAGRAGWPWAVHSMHSAHFRSVLTRFFFPESLNEHCSL